MSNKQEVPRRNKHKLFFLNLILVIICLVLSAIYIFLNNTFYFKKQLKKDFSGKALGRYKLSLI